MEARAANDRIAVKAVQLRIVSRVPMICECNAPECRTLLMVSLEEYGKIRDLRGSFLTAPGHHVEDTELERETAEYAIRVRRRCA